MKEGKIEFKILFEESSYNFLIQNEIKEVNIRIVFTNFEAEKVNSNSIENVNCSALSDMILDPLKIRGNCDNVSRKECLFPYLSEEQKTVALQTQSMCFEKDKPNIKLIEGPPGSGKSLIIQNIVPELLHKNKVLEKKTRILLCAKNNTAVDLTLIKILEKCKTLNVVRYGVDKCIHQKVQSYSINSLITREWKTKCNNRELIAKVSICIIFNALVTCLV